MEPPGKTGGLILRALVRRADAERRGAHVHYCDAQCGGVVARHGADEIAPVDLDPDSPQGEWVPGLSLWPGGERAPWCLDHMARSEFIAHVLRAKQWADAGQSIGALDSTPGSVVDAVLTLRAEWDRVQAEETDRHGARTHRD